MAGGNGTPSRRTTSASGLSQARSRISNSSSAARRCATLRACSQRWQSTAVTRVRREVIGGSGPDSCDDLVDGNMHGIWSQLLPGHSARGVDHEDRMAVHRAHVHAARKAEDAEAGAKYVIAILKDWKSEVELSCQ